MTRYNIGDIVCLVGNQWAGVPTYKVVAVFADYQTARDGSFVYYYGNVLDNEKYSAGEKALPFYMLSAMDSLEAKIIVGESRVFHWAFGSKETGDTKDILFKEGERAWFQVKVENWEKCAQHFSMHLTGEKTQWERERGFDVVRIVPQQNFSPVAETFIEWETRMKEMYFQMVQNLDEMRKQAESSSLFS